MFLDVLPGEHLLELRFQDTATPLLDLLQNVEGQRSVQYRWHADGETVAAEQPDDDQQNLFEAVQAAHGHAEEQARDARRDQGIDDGGVEYDIDRKVPRVNHVDGQQQDDEAGRGSECSHELAVKRLGRAV